MIAEAPTLIVTVADVPSGAVSRLVTEMLPSAANEPPLLAKNCTCVAPASPAPVSVSTSPVVPRPPVAGDTAVTTGASEVDRSPAPASVVGDSASAALTVVPTVWLTVSASGGVTSTLTSGAETAPPGADRIVSDAV